MKAAPINPFDIEIIKGKYATKRAPPAVGGTEGVGFVSEAPSGSKYKVGDWVIPSKPGAFGSFLLLLLITLNYIYLYYKMIKN